MGARCAEKSRQRASVASSPRTSPQAMARGGEMVRPRRVRHVIAGIHKRLQRIDLVEDTVCSLLLRAYPEENSRISSRTKVVTQKRLITGSRARTTPSDNSTQIAGEVAISGRGAAKGVPNCSIAGLCHIAIRVATPRRFGFLIGERIDAVRRRVCARTKVRAAK